MRTMKRAVAICLSAILAFGGVVLSTKNNTEVKAAEWELVWSDEFDGDKLDTNTWNYEIGNGDWGWGNGEVEYYTDREDNVKVSDGCLQIIAKKENYGGKKYTSGRITTKNKKTFLYGKMEARLRVENGNQDGVWPAFWMMGNNISQVGWPRCGEIDIMEHANSKDHVGGCLHWGIGGGKDHDSYGSGSPKPSKDFVFKDNVNNGINGWHTYGLIWDAYHMEWQVDGVTYFQQSITKDNAYCFQKEQFFLFNLALGGTQTGFTNNKTPNDSYQTATMQVDWLRVYTGGSIQTPTTKPVETIDPDAETKITYETVDSVANCPNVFASYFGGANGWGDVTGNISNATNTGVNIHLDRLGDNLWQAQASLNDLEYIAGNEYTYKCTITSDVTKSVRVKVVGDGDGYIFSEDDITVKAGEPYNYEKKVTIPVDYEGPLNLYFGLAKNHFTNENIDANTAVNIGISNMSFVTEKKIVTVIPKPTTSSDATTAQSGNSKVDAVKAPAKVKITKTIRKKKSIKLKFKKIKNAYGYQVKYATNKKFKKAKTKNTRKLSYTIKKLKSQKKYFIKARAYVLDSKKQKVYGKFSKVKKVKTK